MPTAGAPGIGVYNASMAKNRETTYTQNPAMLAVGARPDVLVWRQQSMMVRAMDNPERLIRVGLPGMADAGLIVAVEITPEMVGRTVGVAVQAEFKTPTGKQADAQRNWQRAVEARGGIYQLVRSADDMTALVDRVQRGEW